MKKYTIRDIEKLSGIKAHTIRIWEKRYNILEPDRTESNIRMYSDDELRRILNIAILNNSGVKISHIANLSDDELHQRIISLKDISGSDETFIDRMIVSMVEMKEADFSRILSECIEQKGLIKSVLYVIYPFLEKIGVLWQTGTINPAQEHFVSNIIRQKLLVECDKVGRPDQPKATFILFLPVDELHEIGLLFYNYVLRSRGYGTVYLGQSVPFDDLEKVVAICPSQYLLTFFVAAVPPEEIEMYLHNLHKAFPKHKVFAGGYQLLTNPDMRLPSNLTVIRRVQDFFAEFFREEI
jgi:DNA-binding transcriptional MerR regulator